jgi:hypothetical protein
VIKHTKRAMAAFAAIATASTLAAVTASPTQAAGTFACTAYSNTTNLLAIDPASPYELWNYKYNNVSADTKGTFSARVQIGTGWQVNLAVRGGASGFIWAWRTGGSIYAYDWNVGATSWSRAHQVKDPDGGGDAWGTWSSATNRKKLTVDANNNIFLIDSSNRILRYHYDFTASKWDTWAKPIGTLSGTYDMLWASDHASLWGRKTDGSLTRWRWDAASDRVLPLKYAGGAGWGGYKNIFSAGGDTVFAVRSSDGALVKYRFNDDTNAFVGAGVTIGSGWSNFRDVTAVGNSCKRTYPAIVDAAPIENNSPLEVYATDTGKVELAYANNIGNLVYLHVNDTADFQNLTSQPVDGGAEAFSGRPALVKEADGLVHLYSHNTSGVAKQKKETSTGSGSLTSTWVGEAGVTRGAVDASALSTGGTALAATDSSGSIWAKVQLSTQGWQYAAWNQVRTDAAPFASVTTNPYTSGVVAMYAPGADGSVLTSTINSTGAVSNGNLGTPGTGAVGRITAISYPGGAQRVVVADSSGHLFTKAQDITTRAWQSEWTPVAPETTVTGSPSMVLSPNSGLVQVVARRADDNVMMLATETEQGAGTFAPAQVAGLNDSGASVTDPTAFVYTTAGGGKSWTLVSYDVNRRLLLWDAYDPAFSSSARTSGEAKANDPSFKVVVGKKLG